MDTDAFEEARRAVLERYPGDEAGRMLHAPGLKTAGRFYAFATGDNLVVKLPATRVTELIAAGEGRVCEPRPGRPMRQWVCLTPSGHDAVIGHLVEARAFVAGLRDRQEGARQ